MIQRRHRPRLVFVIGACVEIGMGFEAARRRGSEVHDPIHYDPALCDTPLLAMLAEIGLAGHAAALARESGRELPLVRQLQLLTMKPIFYVINTSEVAENREDILEKVPGPYVIIDAVFEKGLDDLIKKAYETLNLITFFTTGEDETRGWTIQKVSTAPIAGTAIRRPRRPVSS